MRLDIQYVGKVLTGVGLTVWTVGLIEKVTRP